MTTAKRKFWTQADRDIPKHINEKIQKRLAEKHMVSVEVKSFDPNKALTISGYANVATQDRYNEVMPKECWDLKNYLKNPIILAGHDQWHPTSAVGKCLKVEPEDKGLFFEAEIGNPAAGFPLTPMQIELRSLIAQGVLKSLSVGFLAHEWKYNEETETLTYIRAELLEISIVSIPCQQDSQIESVKRLSSVNPQPTVKGVKEMEEELKTKIEGLVASVAKIEAIVPKVEEILTKVNALSEKSASGDEPKDDEEAKSLKAEVEKLKAEKTELETNLAAILDLAEGKTN